MKRLYILMAALLALALFTIPAMAADVNVTVTIEAIYDLTVNDSVADIVIDEWSDYADPWYLDPSSGGSDELNFSINANSLWELEGSYSWDSGGGGNDDWEVWYDIGNGYTHMTGPAELYDGESAGSSVAKDPEFEIKGISYDDGTEDDTLTMTFTLQADD